jgi:chromate transport protein ChrA
MEVFSMIRWITCKAGLSALALITFAVLLALKKIPEPAVIVAAGIVGVVLHHGAR